MKKIITVLLFAFAANILFAQSDTSQIDTTQRTFYDYMYQFFRNYAPPNSSSLEEREETNVEEMRRKAMVCGTRLPLRNFYYYFRHTQFLL